MTEPSAPEFSVICQTGASQRLADDVDADALVGVGRVRRCRWRGVGIQQGDAAAGDDAFLDCGAGRVKGVIDAGLAFLQFDSVAPPTLMTRRLPRSWRVAPGASPSRSPRSSFRSARRIR